MKATVAQWDALQGALQDHLGQKEQTGFAAAFDPNLLTLIEARTFGKRWGQTVGIAVVRQHLKDLRQVWPSFPEGDPLPVPDKGGDADVGSA